jgi:2-desacetyl-2-hydroxyethyl bacteriochlorophyllide A dehydrogenase
MRRAVFKGPRLLEIEDAPEPVPGSGEALLAVHSVGVCGSDIHGYKGVNSRRSAGMVMGHEAIAWVKSIEPGNDGLSPGELVAINPVVGCGACEWCVSGFDNLCEQRRLYGCVPSLDGAFSEEIVVRVSNLVPIEGAAAEAAGALAEPLSVGFHAVQVGPDPCERDVLVVGGGPIGIGAALAARRLGARSVTVSEPNPSRRTLLDRLGFLTVDPTDEKTPESAFDVAYECVGHSATLGAALHAVPPRGTVVFVGLAEEQVQIPATPLMVGERRVVGSSCYTMADFRDVVDWIVSGAEDLVPLIELRVELDELPDVFERYADGSLDAVKTLLVFPGAS